MISELSEHGDTHWVTGTSAPCTSIFKPVWFDSGLPELGPQPTGTYDDATLWWRHENLHREILRDYSSRIQEIRVKRNAFEYEVWDRIPDILNGSTSSREAFTKDCFDGADQREVSWTNRIVDLPINHRRPLMDRLAWRGFDKKAKRQIKRE
jgi:dipeptidase